MILNIQKLMGNSIIDANNNIEAINYIPHTYTTKEKITNFVLYVLKMAIIFIYGPVLLCFFLFRLELFIKIIRQVIIISYSIFFIVFLYTLFNQNKRFFNIDEVAINIEYKNKIKSF